MVHTYLGSSPSPSVCDFLREDFPTLDSRFGGVAATSFRTFHRFLSATSSGWPFSCRPRRTRRA